jgi:hypothetical protein
MAKKKTAKKVAKKAVSKPAAKKATKKTKSAAKPAAKKVAKKTAKKAAKKVVKKTTATKATPAKKVTKKKTATKVAATAKKAAPKKVAKKTEKKVEKKVTAKVVAKKESKAPAKTKKVAEVKEKKTPKVSAKKQKAVVESKKKTRSLEDDFEPMDDGGDEDDEDLGFDDNTRAVVTDDVYIDEDDLLAPSLKDEESIRDNIADEMVTLSEDFNLRDIFEAVRLLDFFVVDSDECIERNCDNPATTLGYCRFHYIRNWKDIKKKQSILMEGKLQNYIEELVSKYPVKYIEAIITDLAEDKSFIGILKELNIESDDDDAYDEDGDDDQDIVFETKQTVKTSFIDD